jgi:hypothetical protein
MLTARKIFGIAAIAVVLAGGIYAVYRSSIYQQCTTDKAKQASYQQEYKSYSTFMIHIDCLGPFAQENHGPIVAFFTIILAFSTIALWFSTRDAAIAAKAAAEHIPRVERAYVSGGAVGITNLPHHFMVTIDNYGKTPAFVGTIWANIAPENELPPIPVYERELAHFGGQMLKADTPGHPSGIVRLWDVVEGRVIYGRIWYRDIFRECHSAGFILRILGPGQTVAVENRDEYWEDRPEPDLGPAARP